MQGLNLKSFSIDGSTYRLNSMNPRDAIRFGARCIKAFGATLSALAEESGGNMQEKAIKGLTSAISSMDDALITELMNEALSYCITPQNEELSDEAVFNQWFLAHPDHLFHAAAMAIFHLAKDFFPKTLATRLKNSRTLRADQSLSQSQPAGKQMP